jgi:16S rRNA (cytosine967-C5)-methyltransferase
MIAPARVAAYDILTAVSAGSADLPTAISTARAALHDDRDRALAADIAIGVQRWRAALDHLIVHYSQRAIDRIDPQIVEILRLSTYQLLHLTRVPAAAVVDDGVTLAKRVRKGSASGFVNAVLRAIARSRHALPFPPRPDPADPDAALNYLSITLSHPRWLAARWLNRFGFEAAEAWLQFNNRPAPLTLRANTLRILAADLAEQLAEEDVRVHPAPFAPDALIVDDGNPLRSASFKNGDFIVQDEASQLVALLAGQHPGTRVLDTCASPGGKAIAVAASLPADGWLVACDIRTRRMELLKRTVSTTGASNIKLVQADLLHPVPFVTLFESVILDAPCSGLGTLRRDPDIRWKRRESDLAPLAVTELRMLHHAADAVAPGGRLVYATCSSEPEENEEVVRSFLETAHPFTLVDLKADDSRLPPEVIDTRGCLRTSPHTHGLEAFFGAVFTRRQL